jgi:hypothetical protein
MADATRTYTQDEVNEIIRRALEQQSREDRVLGHQDLLEMAAEIGIPRDALEAATTELAQTRAVDLARRQDADALRAERATQLRRFGASTMTLGILNAALYLVDTHVTGGTWYFWPLIGSGTVLALQLRNVIFPHDKLARRQRREQRRREHERRRIERAARVRSLIEGGAALAQNAREFETAVQAGVTALLEVATRKLQEHARRLEPPKRDR